LRSAPNLGLPSIRFDSTSVMEPGRTGTQLHRLLKQWELIAPNDALGGTTLAEFKAFIQPALDARAEISKADAGRKFWEQERDKADVPSHKEYLRIVNAIRADKKFGTSCGLYKALKYVTDDERASGLHRKATLAKMAEET
jgi:hypothetical protein